mmetsp:Transcript_9904/g.23589  ORF Transcript_9904/g.23589 Transcript_9904/m.23589 type:complete len:241 (-) Transcript_9904:763-1485(-)
MAELTLQIRNLLLELGDAGMSLVNLRGQTLNLRLLILLLGRTLSCLSGAKLVLGSGISSLLLQALNHLRNETLDLGEWICRAGQSCLDSHSQSGDTLVRAGPASLHDLRQHSCVVVSPGSGGGLNKAVGLGLSSPGLFLDDLGCFVQCCHLILSLLHGDIPLICGLFASVMGLLVGLDVLSKFGLSCGKVALRRGLDLSLGSQSFAGGIKLLVIECDLVLQRLLNLVEFKLSGHLCLVRI